MSEIIREGTSILRDEYITISFEEYKELLVIKGKHEELSYLVGILQQKAEGI